MQRKWRRDWERSKAGPPKSKSTPAKTTVNPFKIIAKHLLPPVAAAGILLAGLTGGYANPTDGQITSGAGTIAQTGGTMTITQNTDKLGINWQTFNIGAGEKVQFIQPGASSVALNRVLGNNASHIYGQLSANGQVFLINPNGVLFAPGAQVNVGGLVASTLNITDHDFQSGKYTFTGNGGSVINQGTITAANGGYVALLAQEVQNGGVIVAQQGTVALGAGNAATLDMNGDGLLGLAVDQAAVNAGAVNHNLIQADGGQVIMTAKAAGNLAGTVVNNGGIIQAHSINNVNGVIRLDGGPTGVVVNSGTLDASGKDAGQTGGTVKVLGDKVTLAAGTKVDVSGDRGGGTALIGGNYQGKGSEQNATATTVNKDATIIADAVTSGHGGKVVVWADDTTNYAGTIAAKGGANGGHGGTVETSGKNTLKVIGTVNAGATNGNGGSWLLDPADITIDSAAAGSIADSLNNKTNVTITTASGSGGNGDITIASPVNWTGTGSLTFLADRDITVNSAISGAGSGALTLSAYRDVNVYAPISNSAGAGVKLRADKTGAGSGTVNFTNGTSTGRVTTDGKVDIYYNPATKTTATINGTSVAVNDYNNKVDYSPYVSAYTGGKTADLTAYMLINNVYDLQYIGNDAVTLAGTYALGKDIDAGDTSNWNVGSNGQGVYNCHGFAPVGTAGTPFTGSFDGDGQVISGLYIDTFNGFSDYAGLFGLVSGATICNAGLENVKIYGSGVSNGGLVGRATNTTITNCYTTGVVNGNSYVGGLAGWAANTTIINCYTTGVVNGNSYVGGLIGYADGGAIIDSYNTATVTGSPSNLLYAGGLVGESNTTIRNSYNAGSVTFSVSYWGSSTSHKNNYIGGLIGYQTGGDITGCYNTGNIALTNKGRYLDYYMGGLVGAYLGGSISDCYSAGKETYTETAKAKYVGNNHLGGLVGYNLNGLTVTRSFWDTVASGQSSSAAGTGLTTAQLTDSAILTSLGWDFTTDGDWFVVDGQTYPFRRSEYSTTITNDHQLQLMAMDLTVNYTLGRNFSLSTYNMALAGFAPVGSVSSPFTGAFNGNGYYINGLTINNPTSAAVGLFGYTGAGAAISKVGLTGVNITGGAGNSYVGSLVGFNGTGATIADCSVAGTITGSGSGSAVGGLVGRNDGTVANGVIVSSTVSGTGDIGGLIGLNNGSLTESFSISTVSGSGNVGGLAGANAGAITDCYINLAGTVTGLDESSYVGGLAGANSGIITTSYNAGAVSGSGTTGGVAGNGAGGTLTAAVWDIGYSGQAYGIGSDHSAAGVTGLTAAQMGKKANYSSNWDFANKWTLNGTRPILQRDLHNAGAISTADQLAAISNERGIYYLLADIDLTGLNWTPIATFGGVLDGGGYTINGLSVYQVGELNSVGLFSYTNGATICNLGLTEVDVTGSYRIGGLVGYADNTAIANCYVTGSVATYGVTGLADVPQYRNDLDTVIAVGGLVGFGKNVNITGCHSSAAVAGAGDGSSNGQHVTTGTQGRAVGGLLGYVASGKVANCYSTGPVSDVGDYVCSGEGGFVGYLGKGGSITNCYTTSRVTSSGQDNYSVGGFIGSNVGSVSDCYSAGTIARIGDPGNAPWLFGFAYTNGHSGPDNFTNCYWNKDTYGPGVIGGNIKFEDFNIGHIDGLTNSQMMAAANYDSSWDFANTWYANGSTYPFLRSEYSTIISNSHQLQLMTMHPDVAYSLARNIDMSDYAMAPGGFGPVGSKDTPFSGTFYGNGHYISNLTINNPTSTAAGLFGYINADASINSVGLSGVNITGGANNQYVGSLVGYNDGGRITDAYSAGVVSGGQNVISTGGLVGYNKGNVAGCYTINTVNGYNSVGGVIGTNVGSLINSYFDGSGVVTGLGTGTYAGGLAGINSGIIATSYSAGLVGTASSGTAGALVGTNGDSGTTSSSVWDTETSGTANGVGDNPAATGVTGLTTAAMGSQANYTADWDFTGPWSIVSGLRPVLQWEYQGSNVITTLNQLRLISANLNGVYILGADIDLTGAWTPLGSADNPFTGILKGNGYTLSGLDIDNSSAAAIGLFSYTKNAGISGVNLTGVNIIANANNLYVGSLVGYNGSGSSVTNSAAAGMITVGGAGSYAGGLVGYNAGSIESSSNAVTVAAGGDNSYAGGLAGINAGSITNCYNTGAVSGSGTAGYVGGLAGENSGGITHSYNTGAVTGSGDNSYVGGLAGGNTGSIEYDYSISPTTASGKNSSVGGLVGINSGAVNYVYSVGTTAGTGDNSVTGGLVGTNGDSGTLTNARWDTETSGQANAIGTGFPAGVQDAQGLATAGMMQNSSYANWDLTGTWGQIDGLSFPYLRAQYDGTPQFFSGQVMDGDIGKNVDLVYTGRVIGQTATVAANGFYYMPVLPNSVPDNSLLLAYVAGDSAYKANSVYLYGTGGGMTGFDLFAGELFVKGSGDISLTNDDLKTVKGGLTTEDIIYSAYDNPLYIWTGHGQNPYYNNNSTCLTVNGNLRAEYYTPEHGSITAVKTATSSGSIDLTFTGDFTMNGEPYSDSILSPGRNLGWGQDQQFTADGNITIKTGGNFIMDYGCDQVYVSEQATMHPKSTPRLIAGGDVTIVCGGYFANKVAETFVFGQDSFWDTDLYTIKTTGENAIVCGGRRLIYAADQLVYSANVPMYFDLGLPYFGGRLSVAETILYFTPSDELIFNTEGGLSKDFTMWGTAYGDAVPATGNGFIYSAANPLTRLLTPTQLMRKEAVIAAHSDNRRAAETGILPPEPIEGTGTSSETVPFLTVIGEGVALPAVGTE